MSKKENTKIISIRCPQDMLDQVDMLSKHMHMSRSAFVVEAIRIFIDQVRKRGGFIVPPRSPKKQS